MVQNDRNSNITCDESWFQTSMAFTFRENKDFLIREPQFCTNSEFSS